MSSRNRRTAAAVSLQKAISRAGKGRRLSPRAASNCVPELRRARDAADASSRKTLEAICATTRCARSAKVSAPRPAEQFSRLAASGTEGPAIIAFSIIIPVVLVGVPMIVMRLERTRVYAYRLYSRWFDIGARGRCEMNLLRAPRRTAQANSKSSG